MLALLRRMDSGSYKPRLYVAAATDALGYTKAKQTEQFFSSPHQVCTKFFLLLSIILQTQHGMEFATSTLDIDRPRV